MFRYVEHPPPTAQVLGEGQFLARAVGPALAKVLFQISQGDYIVKTLSSHVENIMREHQNLIPIIETAERQGNLIYSLGDPRPHPDGNHVLVPFTTYYIPGH